MCTQIDSNTHGSTPLTHRIRYALYDDLRKVGSVLDLLVLDEPLYTIYMTAETYLTRIAEQCAREEIDPTVSIRISSGDPAVSRIKRNRIKIGVLPIDPDPIHWSHIINGLSALARLKLDKVIYIITAGLDNQESDRPQAHLRHTIARNIIKTFDPLLVCSPHMCDTHHSHEAVIFNILQLNAELGVGMDIYYIIGADQVCDPNTDSGLAAAIRKSKNDNERGYHDFRCNKHRIHVAVINRRLKNCRHNQFLKIKKLPHSPFELSASLLQDVLGRKVHQETLAFLPFAAYRYICSHNLYGECPHEREMLQSADIHGGVIQNMSYPEPTL